MNKKTKIVCTIGPKSDSFEVMEKLFLNGMNVVRVNMSHGDYKEHAPKIDNARKISEKYDLPLAVLVDTKGPEVRTNDMENNEIQLIKEQTLIISKEEVLGTNKVISTTYKNLINDVKIGDKILFDDGLIESIVEKIENDEIILRIKNDGVLIDKRGINIPGVQLNFDFISEKDKNDLLWACSKNADFVAASFVNTKDDVLKIRKILDNNNGEEIKIISKIESVSGVSNFDEILEVSDGIMIARGDMGVEFAIEELPSIQKMIVNKCNEKGKPVITATQMLESMKKNPRPTRAEVSDVANAIYDGTSAIMLSAESANGKYPIESVSTMNKIAIKTETTINYEQIMCDNHLIELKKDHPNVMSHAAVEIANNLDINNVMVITKSGYTASAIAKYKQNQNIIAVTNNYKVYNQLSLVWGVIPLYIKENKNVELMIKKAINLAIKKEILKEEEKIVITCGETLERKSNIKTIKIETIKKD